MWLHRQVGLTHECNNMFIFDLSVSHGVYIFYQSLCPNRRDGQPGSLFWFTFPYRSDDTALTSAPTSTMPRMPTSTSRIILSSLLPNFTSSFSSMDCPLSSLNPANIPVYTLSTAVPPSAFSPPLSVRESSSASKKILLVDDTPSIIKVVGRLLQVFDIIPFPSPPPSLWTAIV